MTPFRASHRIPVTDIDIHALSLNQHVQQIIRWAKQNMSRSVCVANVHMLMEAHWNNTFRQILRSADLVTPDGMPLVWMLRLLGAYGQERVAGMDLFTGLCQEAQSQNVSIFCVGSQTQILAKMRCRLENEYPALQIAGMEPLPFRSLTAREDRDLTNQINQTQAGLLFVSLGCPKQEQWIAQHRGKINATMIGLGGVFPVYAGIHKHAPQWVRTSGLEWAYRLCQEPRRLWRRYASTIPPFIWLAIQQLIRCKWIEMKNSDAIRNIGS
ncbi:N-acetylglucosaminyldiphosphoundecaprenol N-acetyl-beta-D-mannosaminyltransferase [Acaryochloris thomasi RCC1774]|uniref:N-acetylglucosaminyldiphosphoundecaprenol N-acetyl-beta-D-mannosaminyltransferase n=1 Tax=Acaryochloris thomasi RCC1774 TaxID=1764569 RepID=A0A2W1JPK1_9CYAN|nr:WecB/TagA/CpsF family glycosyltransferase [Acaryochloris thomasi]PZD71171.1 N-acetylglucosaminyldiphosphoundecaprenol N-acetyl-beta-D-mannosaminyltransferase [Acaryochloris thomasi RCC1774]